MLFFVLSHFVWCPVSYNTILLCCTMLHVLLSFFPLIAITSAYSGIIAGNFNTMILVNQVFLTCPLKQAKIMIKYETIDSEIFSQLPCKKNVEQLQKLFNNYIESTDFAKEDAEYEWSYNDGCKPLLTTITDNTFSVSNITICQCFVDLTNDAITRNSLEIIQTCELLMQKFHLCRHIDEILSLVQGKHRLKRSSAAAASERL